jgi:hypothetical protein
MPNLSFSTGITAPQWPLSCSPWNNTCAFISIDTWPIMNSLWWTDLGYRFKINTVRRLTNFINSYYIDTVTRHSILAPWTFIIFTCINTWLNNILNVLKSNVRAEMSREAIPICNYNFHEYLLRRSTLVYITSQFHRYIRLLYHQWEPHFGKCNTERVIGKALITVWRIRFYN